MNTFECDENNHSDKCPQCNQRIKKLNPHRMCKQKVDLLQMLAKANDWVFVQQGYGVVTDDGAKRGPYRAQAHASRLAWFGLAEHGPVRSGLYRATPEGFAFLRGEHQVPATIWCKNGIVVERDTQMVTINSVKNVFLDKDYWDNYGKIQRNSGDAKS